MNFAKLSLLVILSLASALAVQAAESLPTVSGEAGVTDGDTLRMARATFSDNETTKEVTNIRIRLHGIDAPEKEQICMDAGGNPWSCGLASTKKMVDILKGEIVTCEIRGQDRYERLLAVCSVPSIPDISASIVRSGLAVAYRKYSTDYVLEEEEAKNEKAGMWQGAFDMPWTWRKLH